MKFNCGITWEEKLVARKEWHRWFAWYPIRLGSRDCRWLETIERSGTYEMLSECECGFVYEYRAIGKEEG